MNSRILAVCLAITLIASLAIAHETRTLGEEGNQIKVTVGLLDEPVYDGSKTGIDLIVRNAGDDKPIENLENSLSADITSPDGSATRTLELRPQFGAPGAYTADLILTEPGTYGVRIYGFIGNLEIDESFDRDVGNAADVRFP